MFITRLIRIFKVQRQKKQVPPPPDSLGCAVLSTSLEENLNTVKKMFRSSTDLVVREFSFNEGKRTEMKAALIFIDGLINLALLQDNVLKPLMHGASAFYDAGTAADIQSIQDIQDKVLTAGDVKELYTYDELAQFCLSGNAVLLADGYYKALTIEAKGWEKRAVTEPISETSVRGPREGFTENLRTNTSMIRRKIKDPALTIESKVVGRRTQTQVNLLYIDGLADPELIREVKSRLSQIDIDGVLASSYLEAYIEDSPYTVFPTIWYSEKPDAVAGKLLEGRIAVAVDGAPFVMTMPMLFIENFQSAEDYAKRAPYATATRVVRFIAFLISLFMPALYIALSNFQQELIPTTLLFTMAASAEGVPFPVVLESAIMMVIFEMLQEAGMRMPRPVGQTVSIVGALVMGEAAVQAGLVGAPVVIVVAITAVSSFALPFAVDALSLLRWFLLLLSATMGFFGITIGGFIILVHLASLKSFGAPYMAPIAPLHKASLKDTIIRAPFWAMKKRPEALKPQDIEREDSPSPLK